VRNIPIALAADLSSDATTLCLLTKVIFKDGSRMGFTNLDSELTYNDGTDTLSYPPMNGFTPAQFELTADLTVDNTELVGWVVDTGITEAQIRSGIFDFAKLIVYQINYLEPSHGHILQLAGTAGETVFTENGWKVEFRSKTQQLKQPVNEVYSLTCRAKFGDARCGKPLVWVSGDVTSVGAESDRIFSDTTIVEDDHHYDFGVVRFTSGNNTGFEVEVESQIGNEITLLFPAPFPIQVADEYEIRLDCTYEFSYCKDVHNNVQRFRGEHLIPVSDAGSDQIPGAQM
jgi:uncharacterized phage protein (TIGR02218 family)